MAVCDLCKKETRASELRELRQCYKTDDVKDVCAVCEDRLSRMVRKAHRALPVLVRSRINRITGNKRKELSAKARIALMLFDLLVLAVCLVLIAVINQVV